MRFAKDKRQMLGWLALLAPLPLPFNGVIGWLSLSAFSLAVGLFLVRVASSTYRGLGPWAMNFLGLLYIPILVFEMSTWWQGQQLMRSLTHLILFTLVVKLFSLGKERDYWQSLLAIFFLFLASMGTSVHPSLALYLLCFVFASIWVLTRFTSFEVLGEHGGERLAREPLNLRRFVTATGLFVLLAAVPLFAFLPRLKQPYLFGPGVGNAGAASGGGFTGGLELDTIGSVRTGRSVVLRFSAEGPPLAAERMRFKAATYDIFKSNRWHRGQRIATELKAGADGFFRLAPGATGRWLEVWQSKGMRELVLPSDAVAFSMPAPFVRIDDSEVVTLPIHPNTTFDYKVGLRRPSDPPKAAGKGTSRLDVETSGVTPKMAELAATVMGEGTPRERVEALESYLMREHTYTLELGERNVESPIEEFLFETRSGHCEYFATAMVLLLRSQGVPARMVSGYLGAELNPLEGYYMVRQTNAHAWVEALVEGEGWRIFDPTPPIGRPQASSGGVFQFLSQAYDYVLFRWDRYVLTYGSNDQLGFFVRARDLLGDLRAWFGDDEAAENQGTEAGGEGDSEDTAGERGEWLRPETRWYVTALISLIGLLWLWRARSPWSATLAYRSLRGHLRGRSAEAPERLGPLEVQRQLVDSCPAAAYPTQRIVQLYMEESFGDRLLSDAELAELRDALGHVRRAFRRAA